MIPRSAGRPAGREAVLKGTTFGDIRSGRIYPDLVIAPWSGKGKIAVANLLLTKLDVEMIGLCVPQPMQDRLPPEGQKDTRARDVWILPVQHQ